MIWPMFLLAAAAPSTVPQSVVNDTWVYGEAGNYCMAFFRQKERQLVIRFSAKTGDDTIQYWRRSLPSLTSGMNKAERAEAAGRHYDLQLVVGETSIPLTSQTGHLDPKYVPGRAYVFGVDDQRFISALATAHSLEMRHRGQLVARFDVANNAELSKRLATCVASR